MTNYKQYDELRRAEPFRSFRIVMSDGAKFFVPHRDFTWRSPVGGTIVVAAERGDVLHLVDPLHVTRFEEAERNGSKKETARRR
jgi:hypothetical protein